MKAQSRVEIINEMQGLVFDCTPADIDSGSCIAATGEQLLSTFSIDPNNPGTGKLPPSGTRCSMLVKLILVTIDFPFLQVSSSQFYFLSSFCFAFSPT